MALQQRHEIPREEWSGSFEGVTKEHAGQDVTIEVLDREFGDGHEARRLPLASVEYDPKKSRSKSVDATAGIRSCCVTPSTGLAGSSATAPPR